MAREPLGMIPLVEALQPLRRTEDRVTLIRWRLERISDEGKRRFEMSVLEQILGRVSE